MSRAGAGSRGAGSRAGSRRDIDEDARTTVSEDVVLNRRRNFKGSFHSFIEVAQYFFLVVGMTVVVVFSIWALFFAIARMAPEFFDFLLSLVGEAKGKKSRQRSVDEF